jgi:hypothetical protein
VRPPHLPAATLRTPALPGFRVSGDAKSANFESFGASPADHTNPAMSEVPHLSALAVTQRPIPRTPGRPTPFERVQMNSPSERRHQARPLDHPDQCGLFERVQIRDASAEIPQRSPGRGSVPSAPRSFERVQTPTVSRETLADRLPHVPFERVQIRTGSSGVLIPPRPPYAPPRPFAAPDSRPRFTPTTQEENRMPPPE